MKRMNLCELDEKTTQKLLEGYRTGSIADEKLEIKLYMDYRFRNFSAVELAAREHISRHTVYRKVNKVNDYLQSITGKKY